MANETDGLYFSIMADVAEFLRSMSQASEAATGAAATMVSAGNSMAGAFDPAATAAVNLGNALNGQQFSAADAAMKALQDQAAQLGVELKQLADEAAAAALASQMHDLFVAMAQGLAAAGKELQDFGNGMMALGGILSAAITVPLAAIGAAGFEAGRSLDEAFDLIRAKTGEMAEGVNNLGETFRHVFANVPESAKDVALALSLLHDRTGAVGDDLEKLSTQFLQLSHLTGEQVAPLLNLVTREFGDMGVKSNEWASALDYLYGLTEKTGTSLGKLLQESIQYGAPLRALGYGFEEATALVAKFEKEGVNTVTVLAGMRLAVANFAKAGIDPPAGFQAFIQKVNELDRATATLTAGQVVNKRAMNDVADAIKGAHFQTDGLVASVKNSGETIARATVETESWGEKWVKFKNQLTLALEPLGNVLQSMAQSALAAMSKLFPYVKMLGDAFASLGPTAQVVIVALAGLAAAAGPTLLAIGLLASQFGQLLIAAPAILAFFEGLSIVGLLSGLFEVLAIAAAAVAVAIAAWKIGEWLLSLDGVQKAIALIGAGFDLMVKWITDAYNVTVGLVEAFLKLDGTQAVIAALSSAWDEFVRIAKIVGDYFGNTILPMFMEGGALVLGIIAVGVGVALLAAGLAALAIIAGAVAVAFGAWTIFDNIIKPAIIGVVEAVKMLVDWLSKIPGVAAVVQKLSEGWAAVKKALEDAAAASKKTNDEQAKTPGIVAQITTGIKSMAASIGVANIDWDTFGKKTKEVKANSDELKAAIKAQAAEWKTLIDSMKLLGVEKGPEEAFTRAANAFKVMQAAFDKGKITVAEFQAGWEGLQKALDPINAALLKTVGAAQAANPQLDQMAAGLARISAIMSQQKIEADAWSHTWDGLNERTMQFATLLGETALETGKITGAFESLGVEISKTFRDKADDARAFYGTISTLTDKEKAEQGIAAQDIERAWVAMEQTRIDAALRSGQEISNAEKLQLLTRKQALDDFTNTSMKSMDILGVKFESVAKDISGALADAFFKGKGFVEAFQTAFEKMAKSMLDNLINGVLKGLMGDFSQLQGQVNGLIKSFTDLFGMTSKVATTAAGGAGGAGGGAGAAANSLSGVVPIVGAIGSVVSAISGIISNFQLSHMNENIGRIEVTTRGQLNVALQVQSYLAQYLPGIRDGIMMCAERLHEISVASTEMLAGGGGGTSKEMLDVIAWLEDISHTSYTVGNAIVNGLHDIWNLINEGTNKILLMIAQADSLIYQTLAKPGFQGGPLGNPTNTTGSQHSNVTQNNTFNVSTSQTPQQTANLVLQQLRLSMGRI